MSISYKDFWNYCKSLSWFLRTCQTSRTNLIYNDLRSLFHCYLPSTKKILTVCSCHVTYAFQSESTLYSCLNVKELLARSRRKIRSLSDWYWTRTQNHLVRKRTLNHLAKLTNGWVFVYELSGSGLESSSSHLKKILLEENIVIIKSRTKFYVTYTIFFSREF